MFGPRLGTGRSLALERPTEILKVGLPSGTMEVEAFQWQATLLDDQARPGALLGQPCLDLGLLARVNAPRTRPRASEDGVDRATDAHVAGDLGDPACKPFRIRARLP